MGAKSGLEELATIDVVKAVAGWRLPQSESEVADRSPYETLWLRVYAWFFLVAGLAYYFLIGRDFSSADVLFFSEIEFMSILALSQFALHFLYWRMANKVVLSYSLKRLRTKVPSDSACPLTLEIFQNGVVTGYDEGYIWIEEGTLYYKGLQTVFRINCTDVEPTKKWPRKHRPHLDSGRLPRWIYLFGNPDRMQLHIKLIDPFEDYDARRRSALFDKNLAKWLAERPVGSLESKLPPSDLHPSLRSIGKFRYEGLAAGFLLIVVNLVLILTARIHRTGSDMDQLSNLIPVVVGGVLLMFAIRMTIQNAHNIKVRRKLANLALSELPTN